MKTLNVFLRFSPTDKILVGTIAEHEKELYFEYAPEFLSKDLWLSPYKLPPQRDSFQFKDYDFGSIFGLFNDSLPDGWGLLLMDRYLRKQGVDTNTLSVLDRLAFLGDSTMGGLVYGPATKHDGYEQLIDLQSIAAQTREIIESEDFEILPDLMKAGGSPQGARPKILVGLNGDQLISGADDLPDGFEHWLIKFPSKDDFPDSGRIEQAYALMAKDAGLLMTETRLFEVSTGEAFFGIKRFDRKENQRFHIHSLGGLIHSNFRIPGCDYSEFFRRILDLTKNQEDVERGFRQMIFNIISNNRDDHVKNFAFMFDEHNEWKLTPAYDLMYSRGPGGEHSMDIAGEGRSPGLKHVQRIGSIAGLKPRKIKDIVAEVSAVLKQWEDYAAQTNVSEASVDYIQERIDRNLDCLS